MPVPEVMVRNSERKPIRPRAGTVNSMRIRPLPSSTMSVSSPLRRPICSITEPWCCSSTSKITLSNGSCFSPSISFMITSGRDTPSSKPSRRMVSISTDRCSSPRPDTLKRSGVGPRLHAQGDVVDQFFFQRSLMLREVTYLPSLAGERRVVDLEGHAHRRLVHGQRRQRFHVLRIAQGVGNFQAFHAGDADDVAGLGFRHFHAVQGHGSP
jgi:hypothetical protein